MKLTKRAAKHITQELDYDRQIALINLMDALTVYNKKANLVTLIDVVADCQSFLNGLSTYKR